eukprot:TRINITY_DN8039_c2_g1_i2.p1 TRINITY_DN8039_c2_g1~~TRINITY_DN8039_c2_g1_i2.p1  ORF type:complete len:1282 (+),score=565.69 TRINITY_DN8039_c2_g1_i2:104-3949(+)
MRAAHPAAPPAARGRDSGNGARRGSGARAVAPPASELPPVPAGVSAHVAAAPQSAAASQAPQPAAPTPPGNVPVRVVVRVRPLLPHELRRGETRAALPTGAQTLRTTCPAEGGRRMETQQHSFDAVLGPAATQEDVFAAVDIAGLVDAALDGYAATVLAYGQTGSGKTHSMLGPSGGSPQCLDPAGPLYSDRGLVPRLAEELFKRLRELAAGQQFTFSVTCNIFEIYNEELIDLLAGDDDGGAPREQLRLEGARETFHIRGLVEKQLHEPADLLQLIGAATARRHVAATAMNERSSRSHTVVQINSLHRDEAQGTVTTSQLNLVDLAGSERVGKTHATGKTAFEGTRINLSLSTLGKVITQLCKGEKHISFRDSLLTRVLQNSLGGNALTTLICAMSPLPVHQPETTSTLRFAESAKQIRNKVRVNKQRTAGEWEILCKQKDDEIASLLQKLELATRKAERQQSVIPGEGSVREASMVLGGADLEELEETQARLEAALEEGVQLRKALEAAERKLLERDNHLSYLKQRGEEDELHHLERQAGLEEKLQELQRKVEDHEQEMRAKDNRCGDLQLQIDELEVELDALNDEMRSKEEEIEQRSSELALERLEMMEKFAELTTDRDQAAEEAERLRAKAADAEAVASAAQQSRSAAEEKLQSTVDELRKQLELREAGAREQQRAAELAQSQAESEQSLLRERIAESGRRAEELDRQLQEKTEAGAALEADLRSVRSDLLRKTQELAQQATRVAEVQAQLQRAQADATQHSASVDALKGGESRMQQALQQKDAELSERQQELGRLQVALQEREAQLAAAQAAAEQRDRELGEARRAGEEEKTARARDAQEAAALRQRLQELEGRLREREEAAHQAAGQHSAALSAAEQQAVEARAAVAALEGELQRRDEAQRQEREEAARQCAVLEEERGRLQEQLQARGRDLEGQREAKLKAAQLEQDCAAAREENRRLKDELDAARKERMESKKKHDEGAAELKEARITLEQQKRDLDLKDRAMHELSARLEKTKQYAERLSEQVKQHEEKARSLSYAADQAAAAADRAEGEVDRQQKVIRALEQAVARKSDELVTVQRGLANIMEELNKTSADQWRHTRERIGAAAKGLMPRSGKLDQLVDKLHEESAQHDFVCAVSHYCEYRKDELAAMEKQSNTVQPGDVVLPRLRAQAAETLADFSRMREVLESMEFYDPDDERARTYSLGETTELAQRVQAVLNRLDRCMVAEKSGTPNDPLTHLLGLGFTEDQCRAALASANQNLARAADILLSGSPT